jgi:hypothetical protein
MKNAQNYNLASSLLKTVACSDIVSEYELTQASDKNLQEILNEEKNKKEQQKTTDNNQEQITP